MTLRAAIIGASGFIGRATAEKLVKLGAILYLFDRRPPDEASLTDQARFVEGDLFTGVGLASVPWSTLDVVYHLAAAGVSAQDREWSDCVKANIVGTQRLLNSMEAASRPPRLIYTRSFYENHINKTSMQNNPYVITKYAATELIRSYRSRAKASVVELTLFQVYGNSREAGNVVSHIVRNLCAGNVVELGSGRVLRDWVFIDDVAEALVKSAELRGGAFDVGTGHLTSLRQVAFAIARALGAREQLLSFDPSKDRDDLDIVQAAEHKVPDWRPRHSIEEGILQMASGLRAGAR